MEDGRTNGAIGYLEWLIGQVPPEAVPEIRAEIEDHKANRELMREMNSKENEAGS